MKTNRRKFVSATALAGGSAAVLPLSCFGSTNSPKQDYPDYSILDKAPPRPVLKRALFPSPVIIETVELLRDRDNFICRVRSKDGAAGISIGHPFISKQGYPMFENCVRQSLFILSRVVTQRSHHRTRRTAWS